MHPGKLLLGEAWLFIRSKICYYITVNCVIHAFLDDLCILLVINNFDLQGFGSCWWLFFFFFFWVDVMCEYIFIILFVVAGDQRLYMNEVEIATMMITKIEIMMLQHWQITWVRPSDMAFTAMMTLMRCLLSFSQKIPSNWLLSFFWGGGVNCMLLSFFF